MVEVKPRGRIVIPAALRRQLGIEEGSQLAAFAEGGALVLLPRTEAKARLRGMLAGVTDSMADELARERREWARSESA